MHAARRVDEMEAARDLLLELGVEPRIATASVALLAELAESEGAIGSWPMTTQPAAETPTERPSAGCSCRARTTCTSTSLRTCLAADRRPSTLARRFAELGLAGFALKSHYTSTAERAQVVSARRAGASQVVGTLTLNWAVGGMNAARRRDRRARGRADRLDADGRLAGGDGGADASRRTATRSRCGRGSSTSCASLGLSVDAGARHRRRRAAPARDARRAAGDRAARADPRDGPPRARRHVRGRRRRARGGRRPTSSSRIRSSPARTSRSRTRSRSPSAAACSSAA